MKRSPADREKELLFAASKFSADGFLGNDNRSVEEIIDADAAALESLGTSREKIAAALSAVFDKAESALGDPVIVLPGISAIHHEARGKIPSPFRGDGVFQKGEVEINFTETGKTVFITRLGINLIGKHGFFQGRGSRYRIEPADILQLL